MYKSHNHDHEIIHSSFFILYLVFLTGNAEKKREEGADVSSTHSHTHTYIQYSTLPVCASYLAIRSSSPAQHS